jgi:hypothetical protein
MNPQAGQNPYLELLNKLQSGGSQAPGAGGNPGIEALMQHTANSAGGPPGGAPGGQASALAQAQGAGGMAPQQPEIEDAAIPGKNPGISKNLLGAMNQLHGAITQMTDPQEIRMIRSIIVLLNHLIQQDQEVQNQRTGSMTPAQPGQSQLGGQGGPQAPGPGGPPEGGAPGGAPGGMPSGLQPGSPSPAM